MDHAQPKRKIDQTNAEEMNACNYTFENRPRGENGCTENDTYVKDYAKLDQLLNASDFVAY